MKHFNIHFGLPAATAALILFAGAGCGRDSVKVYHADASDTATPTPPAAAMPAAPAGMSGGMPEGIVASDTGNQPPLQYTLPAGWEKKALTQMRAASFGILQDGKQADVSVVPLGGMAGNDAANVNRWRGAVGLPTLAEADIAKLAEKVPVADLTGDLYDLAGLSLIHI